MEASTSETGSLIRKMDTECLFLSQDIRTKDNEGMVRWMELELKSALMILNLKDSFRKMKKMEKENNFLKMGRIMKESLRTTRGADLGFTNGVMGGSMQGSGVKGSSTAQECTCEEMVSSTMASMKTMKKKVMGYLHGQTEAGSKVSGKETNKTDEEYLLFVMGHLGVDCETTAE